MGPMVVGHAPTDIGDKAAFLVNKSASNAARFQEVEAGLGDEVGDVWRVLESSLLRVYCYECIATSVLLRVHCYECITTSVLLRVYWKNVNDRSHCDALFTTTWQNYGAGNVMVTPVPPSLELHAVAAFALLQRLPELMWSKYGHTYVWKTIYFFFNI